MPQAQTSESNDLAAPRRSLKGPQIRAAQIVPATFSEAENTVDVCWTTGSRRRAWDWEVGAYDEELTVSPESVDMTRFEAGVVQALDGHRVHGGVGAILGIAQRGWIENGSGYATVKLSVNPDNAGIVADIRAGVIRSISFGYSVERYEVTQAAARTDGGTVPLYRATLWTPQEISFVTVPADPNAQTRAAQAPASISSTRAVAPAHQTNGEPMDDDLNPGGTPSAPESAARQQAALSTLAAVAQPASVDLVARHTEIIALCAREGRPGDAADFIRQGLTPEQVGLRILNARAAEDEQSGGHRNVHTQTVRDEHQTRLNGMTEAMLSRVDGGAQLTDNGRQYRGMSIIEMGRDMLEASGVRTRGMDRLALATRILQHRSGGMHTTSDFGFVVANVANKRLRNAYGENEGTYSRWARRAPNAPDFKAITVGQLSGMPDLLKTNEAGEFKYGTITDGQETYSLITYGRIVAFSRQAMINDDVRAFDRLVTGFGSASARLENRLVYSQLTANANMADGVALFEATSHKNLATGGGSALSLTALGSARALMRKQTGLQGELLNLAPSFLIVPAELEQTAYSLTSANYVPAKPSDVNEFRSGGRTALDPIVEPLLDASSATAWYLAASNSAVDTVEYCWLDGAEGPVIESEMGFEVDGLQFKCREDFAAKAIDHRGLFKGAGA